MPRAVQVLRRRAGKAVRQGRAHPASAAVTLILVLGLAAGQLAASAPTTHPTTQEYAPLPQAPQGWSLREVARLPVSPTRVASDGSGKFLYVLGTNGDVWKLNPADSSLAQLFKGEKYSPGDVSAFGSRANSTSSSTCATRR